MITQVAGYWHIYNFLQKEIQRMVSGRDRGGDYTPSRKHMGKVKTIEVRARGDWNG